MKRWSNERDNYNNLESSNTWRVSVLPKSSKYSLYVFPETFFRMARLIVFPIYPSVLSVQSKMKIQIADVNQHFSHRIIPPTRSHPYKESPASRRRNPTPKNPRSSSDPSF